MKKNQYGVTLISLVVTIVVMLIIAGAAIATLGGDNGIITNAQRSRAGTSEAEVVEKMGMAYNNIRSTASSNMAIEVGYKPSVHVEEYLDGIESDIGADDVNIIETDPDSDLKADPADFAEGKYNVYIDYTTANKPVIVIVYTDATFYQPVPTSATTYPVATTATTVEYPVDNQYAILVAQIEFTTSSVKYVEPIKTVLKTN